MNKIKKETLDEEAIKKYTGYFDLKLVKGLDLSQKGINNIIGVSACLNITYLNLSGNFISNLHHLKDLKGLIYLDLSNNKITDLKDLDQLTNLRKLKLEGNLISSLKQIRKLENLKNLKSLSFKTPGEKLSNPFVTMENYKAYIKEKLPNLELLDHIPIEADQFDIPEVLKTSKLTIDRLQKFVHESNTTLEKDYDQLEELKKKSNDENLNYQRRIAQMDHKLSHIDVLINQIENLI